MKITTNKSDPPGKKQVSDRHYKDAADQSRQQKMEGKDTPFQKALRNAEGKNKKVFHWNDKTKTSSDTPFEGSRPIATKSTADTPARKPQPEKKVVIPEAKAEVKGQPGAKIPVKANTITPKVKQNQHGQRSHGVVKNNVLRKIDAALNPSKYGATSNNGKDININRSKPYSSGKAKSAGYDINLGGDKSQKISVKKLKPKAILKAAKEKGYIK